MKKSEMKPKILLLGMNHASIINSLLIGFKEINVDAYGISFEANRSKYCNYSNISCVYPHVKINYFVFKWYTFIGIIRLFYQVVKHDVIHVFSDIRLHTRVELIILNFIFNFLAKKKIKYVTFVGSEVRIPDVDFQINTHYYKAYSHKNYEYAFESKVHSLELQNKFHNWGFQLLCTPDTKKYIQPNLFNVDKIIQHASTINFSRQQCNKTEFTVIHAPTAKVAKGTEIIREKMKVICSLFDNVRYIEVAGVSNDEYQELISKSDLLIDQVIWGYYGVAAIQAMAVGIPVACYLNISPEDNSSLTDIPILNINEDNFIEIISKFISDDQLIQDVSDKAKLFYANNHCPAVVANNVLSQY